MRVIITGTGNLGFGIARMLQERGHEVTVVGENASTALSGRGFAGRIIDGPPTDQDVLAAAGIEGAQVFIAATADDRNNAMATQIARAMFGVGKALARISDPGLASFYRSEGIEVICPTCAGMDQIMAALSEGVPRVVDEVRDPDIQAVVPRAEWIGRPVGTLIPPGGWRVLGIVSQDRLVEAGSRRIVAGEDTIVLGRGAAK